MDEWNEKISKLRDVLENMKVELYTIKNEDLSVLDEYRKTLYLKMLCTVVRYENIPTEMQSLYLRRIINGMNAEAVIEDYMRKAVEISETDICEFISFLRQNEIRYYFAFEGMLLAAMGRQTENNYEYLAELIELSGITKGELEYLALLAKSVLCQNGKYYEQAKEKITDHVAKIDFSEYIKGFYSGAIINNEQFVYYYGANEDSTEKMNLERRYTAKKVKFENIAINVWEPLEFAGCEEVVFENCRFVGRPYEKNVQAANIGFCGCKKIEISGCKFENFGYPIIVLENTQKVDVKQSIFINCNIHNIYEESRFMISGKKGIILYVKDKTKPQVTIKGAEFRNCIGYSEQLGVTAWSIIANCECHVETCRFYNIWNYSYNGRCWDGDKQEKQYELKKENNNGLFTEDSEDINNEIVGSARFSPNSAE